MARESVIVTLWPKNPLCLLVSVFPDWFWDNMIPPGTRNGSMIPPFCRSCHGPRICRRHASAQKSIVSSCLCLSRLISGPPDHPTQQGSPAAPLFAGCVTAREIVIIMLLQPENLFVSSFVCLFSINFGTTWWRVRMRKFLVGWIYRL